MNLFQVLTVVVVNNQSAARNFFTAISLDAHNDNIRNLAQNSASVDDEVSVVPKCMAYLCGVFVFKGKVRNIELATSFLGTA